MTKTELVAAIAAKTELTKTAVEAVLKAQTEVITEAVKGGDKVTLTGLVTFGSRDVAARDWPIPSKPGETKHVEAHVTPTAKVAGPFKDALKA